VGFVLDRLMSVVEQRFKTALLPRLRNGLPRTQNVGKGFRRNGLGWRLLRDINLEISRKGEFVAIVGLFRAGKTTFMSMIAGLHRPEPRQPLR